MLNITFSVWVSKTSEFSFELGVIEDNIESNTNPPTLDGDWNFNDKNNTFTLMS